MALEQGALLQLCICMCHLCVLAYSHGVRTCCLHTRPCLLTRRAKLSAVWPALGPAVSSRMCRHVLMGCARVSSHGVAKTALAERLGALHNTVPRRVVAHCAWRLRGHIACARKSRKGASQGPLGTAMVKRPLCRLCFLSMASDMAFVVSSRTRLQFRTYHS